MGGGEALAPIRPLSLRERVGVRGVLEG